MFKRFFKRCLASLLALIILCGTLCPTHVFASVNISKEDYGTQIGNALVWNGFGSARIYDLARYYEGIALEDTNQIVLKMTLESNAEETVGWAKWGKLTSNLEWTLKDGTDVTKKIIKEQLLNDEKYSDSLHEIGVPDAFSSIEELGNALFRKTQGSMGQATLLNLCQRTALLLYVRMHPEKSMVGSSEVEIYKDSSSSKSNAVYDQVVSSTLALGHPETLGKQLDGITSINVDNTALVTLGKSGLNYYSYSVGNVGILGLDIVSLKNIKSGTLKVPETPDEPTSSSDDDIKEYEEDKQKVVDFWKNQTVYAVNDYCLYICLSEFVKFYDEELPKIAKTKEWQKVEKFSSHLTVIKTFYNMFGDYFPCVYELYHKNNSDANGKSIADLVKEANLENASLDSINLNGFGEGEYNPNVDDSTPIGQFYTVNSKIPIVSYDRDGILGQYPVNKDLDMLLEEIQQKQKHNNKTNQQNNYSDYNNFKPSGDSTETDEDKYGWNNPNVKYDPSDIRYYLTDDKIQDMVNHTSAFFENWFSSVKPVDGNGKATSLAAVTINKNVLEGMGYSATYIPMRTNLYSVDVIKQYKDNEEFYDFFLKYGFMRKALLIDTSGTAAVDYYNAGGKLTGSVKVCTLRDLIESGERDVVLYLDSNLYNADDALDEGIKFLEARAGNMHKIYNALTCFQPLYDSQSLFNNVSNYVSAVSSQDVKDAIAKSVDDEAELEEGEKFKCDADEFRKQFRRIMLSRYDFNINGVMDKDDTDDMVDYCDELVYSLDMCSLYTLNERVLKTGDYTSYDDSIRSMLNEIHNSRYVHIKGKSEDTLFIHGDVTTEDDNLDTLVLSSITIHKHLSMENTYEEDVKDEEGEDLGKNTYTRIKGYTPMVGLSYVSLLYRNSELYNLANAVENDNPVFMASDALCGISEANQWYRNSLLNYILLRNLESNSQVDYSYVVDLDCPVYMDIFGNILTESGTVVIPAAANATLHEGSFKESNYAVALYTCYGDSYQVPTDLPGAYSVIFPYFVPDLNNGVFVKNAITAQVNGNSIRFDKISQYDATVQQAVRDAYKAKLTRNSLGGNVTCLNWMAMVKIANEVMRGAPIENIDKEKENLVTALKAKSGVVAASKLESLLESLNGEMSNTLVAIPDFTRMDGMEYWVALAIKLITVATVAVVVVFVYRDGVSGNLGLRTLFKSLSAIALTISCVVLIPSIFQLTYYSANKFLLGNEVSRILLVNEEKRQCGIEIGMTGIKDVESTDDFALQLDWISVPWYEQIEKVMFESTLDNLQETKLKAYRESVIYNNSDVDLYNDGVYVSIDSLFDSVSIDYNFHATDVKLKGLYLYANDKQQTAGFYSPYYVFLRNLTANINEYNQWRGNVGDDFSDLDSAFDAYTKDANLDIDSWNYTTKYVSGNRLKTVGLSKNYFTSDSFMYRDRDILRLYQIYGPIPDDFLPEGGIDEDDADAQVKLDEEYAQRLGELEANSFDRASLYSPAHRKQFRSSLWYNERAIEDLDRRIEIMDDYAREFIVSNQDLLTKVTDETFIKVMALHLAIKYNQIFGVHTANAIEIHNLDSTDLIRLCVLKGEEAVMGAPMSYARFIYNFGGEAAVYIAAILSVVMWIGSFIKPLCTVIVYISVFLSIFIFRVCLRKPSANLLGYICTTGLLCATNLLHAVILKLGVNLPNFGLPVLGCLLFMLLGQIIYLLLLSYVTGVALKDWANLGASEYEREARLIASKFRDEDVNIRLNGAIKNHEDNWDYYNDLVNQHRARNE